MLYGPAMLPLGVKYVAQKHLGLFTEDVPLQHAEQMGHRFGKSSVFNEELDKDEIAERIGAVQFKRAAQFPFTAPAFPFPVIKQSNFVAENVVVSPRQEFLVDSSGSCDVTGICRQIALCKFLSHFKITFRQVTGQRSDEQFKSIGVHHGMIGNIRSFRWLTT